MSSDTFQIAQVVTTFTAALRSVGTACTLAGIGVYLHQRNFIVGEGKRTLALISQQVTIPLLLFTKIVYCNQDWSDRPCPNITANLSDVWTLLLWPIYVVGCGLLVGWLAAIFAGTPKSQVRSVLAACTFGNSTGLPITLLTVVHSNFPKTTELGQVDPTLFLSVYLLLYPVLQWGVGGWLLAPTNPVTDNQVRKNVKVVQNYGNGTEVSPLSTRAADRQWFSAIKRNVLNNKLTRKIYKKLRRGISETDASLYISNVDLLQLGANQESENRFFSNKFEDVEDSSQTLSVMSNSTPDERTPLKISVRGEEHHVNDEESVYESESFLDTLSEICSRCLQPPVIGAVLGLVVAATPLRGLFVDIMNRADAAPLEWFFDALYAAGQAAVPLNMMILGCNLSASQMADQDRSSLLSRKTMAAIVIGKMVVLPIIGILSCYIFSRFLWDIPSDIDASFYLVAMIVFITPTANNVMVMVELSGSGSKEGIARVIAWQYAAAPVLLSLSMTAVVGVASQW